MTAVNYTTPREDVPLILVTNDDGIESPGLVAAVRAVAPLGTVIVAAPTTQQTAMGRSMVGNRSDWFHPTPIAVSDEHVSAYHLDASPALVVRHAVAILCGNRFPDLVVSGINYGENLGSNITISGTVGAALQAASFGLPAIAVSLQTEIDNHYHYGTMNWDDAIRVTRKFAARLLSLTFDGAQPRDGAQRLNRLSDGIPVLPFDVLKIDIPSSCPPGTEERLTRLSDRHYFHSFVENPHLESTIGDGITRVDVDIDRLNRDDDIYAIAVDEVVSVTPLRMDFTASMRESERILSAIFPRTG